MLCGISGRNFLESCVRQCKGIDTKPLKIFQSLRVHWGRFFNEQSTSYLSPRSVRDISFSLFLSPVSSSHAGAMKDSFFNYFLVYRDPVLSYNFNRFKF